MAWYLLGTRKLAVRRLDLDRGFTVGLLLLAAAASVCSGQDTGVSPGAGEPDAPSPDADEARLVWTELRIVDRRARILSLPADPESYITSTVISSKYYYELTPAHWIAIASDYDDGVAFWSDANHKRIMKGGLQEGAVAAGIFDGTSSTVDGIAVDWLANNVYWTDAAYNWIVVMDYNMTWFKIVVDDELEKPRGIVVYPQLGYLFWTDWGSSQRIERSTLGGKDRQMLVDTGLYFPNGLTIDYTTDKLYWTDADPSGSRLEVSDLDGRNRSTLYSHEVDQGHFFDVAVFQNYIFISDWFNGIRCIHKDTGEHYFSLNIGGRPFGLTTHGPGLLPGSSSPCDSKPCDQLCVSDPGGFKCLCTEGFDLLSDNRTCYRENITLAKPQILLATQNSLCHFPSNFPDLSLPSNYQRSCILTNRSHVVAMDIDVRSKTVFFSDFTDKTIQSVRLMDGAKVQLVAGGMGSVEGIAVDWLSQNLYWTDFQLNHISVARYDGRNRKVLLKDDIMDPRSIVIHAGLRLMFWTEFGPPSQIERANLDGSDRRIILDNVEGLNGLAIDFDANRLYYADRQTGSIQHMDFEGNGRTRLYSRTGAQYFDIDIHKDYLLWTEWNTFNGLHTINKENRRIVQSHSIANESTYGVRVYSDDRQPDFENLCENNGGCQHLCLPVSPDAIRCECSVGYKVHTDGRSCVPALDILYNDFLLASDTYLHSIFQFNLSDPNLPYSMLQLDSRTIQSPVGLAYDPIKGQIYWSDVVQNTIHRAFIFNGTQEILFTHEHVDTPDALTIDPTSRLLFWTDMGLPSIQVSHLDGTNRKSLVLEDIRLPRAILADPGNGYLYWSDWGDVPKIERAYMDGSNRRILANTTLGWPNGLALDYRANKLYWCDAKTDLIEVLDLSTMVRTVLIDLGPNSHPFSLALHGPYIYWSDWAKKSLSRADKDTGANNGSVGTADFARLNGLFSYSRQENAPFSNACVDGLTNGGCTNLCLPTPGGRVCACPDGSTLANDGVSCTGAIRCQATFYHGRVEAECLRVPGSTCNVECDAGYRPTDTRISCGQDGFWDVANDSVCELVTCPSLSTPEHATVVVCLAPHVHGNQCRFRCQVGFMQMGGQEEVSCTIDGQWSSSLLNCQAVTCPSLPALRDGVYTPEGCSTAPSTFNTTCRILCPQGYQLVGATLRMCQANAQWTDSDRRSDCIDIMPPDFGDTCPGNFSTTADFGQTTANVTWPEPQPLDNSGNVPILTSDVHPPFVSGEGARVVTYRASDANNNTAICSFTVQVEVLSCDMLGHPINGFFEEECTQHYGSTCTVRCNDGYVRQGTAQRTCIRENGLMGWTGTPGRCELIECSEPSLSSVNVLKADCSPPYYYRAECSYTCAPGYEHSSGSERRICENNGLWSGSQLVCQRLKCPPLSLPEHATVSPIGCQTQQDYTYFNDVCVLSCEEGYHLMGIPAHTCLASGEWSNADDAHFCQDVAAPHFNGTCPNDFNLIAPRGKDEAVVNWTTPVVMDNEGHELVVTTSREPGVALPGGVHSILIRATDQAGNQGTCRFSVNITVIHCQLHPFPHFGEFQGEPCENYYGAQCNFQCMVGYRLRGSRVRTCEWSGQISEPATWTGEAPVCEAVMCPMFDFPVNDVGLWGCNDQAESLPYSSSCRTVCLNGKQATAESGEGIRRCTETGTWSGENIQCEDVQCPVLTAPAFGFINCSTESPIYGTVCRFTCQEGFYLTGMYATVCGNQGNWLTRGQNSCRDVMAPVFAAPCPRIVIDLVPDQCAEGAIVSYQQPTAQDNSGTVNVTGGEGDILDTLWPFGRYERSFTAQDPSGNTADCLLIINIQRIDCRALLAPYHGSITSQSCGDRAGSIAVFSCDAGYALFGSKYLACGEDGQWNSTIPQCSAVYCSALETPQNGTLTPEQCTGTEVLFDTECYVECTEGYRLIGGSSTTCLRSGQWSNNISNSQCIDVTSPEFESCPPAESYILPQGQADMRVILPTPNATDNSGVAPEIIAGNENYILGVGTTFFTFMARDQAGNEASCLTEITIIDAEPPTVVSCPNGTVLETQSLPATPEWEEPVFEDNAPGLVVNSDGKSGGRVFQWGRYAVIYTATDGSSNSNTCKIIFDIVDNTECPPLQAPPNGALACENNNACTVHCNSGYVFLVQPKAEYLCLDSGRWSHELLPGSKPYLPACTTRSSSGRVRWQRRDEYAFRRHHLEGGRTCSDSQEEIQRKFVELFMRGDFRYCQQDPANNCKLDNIVVTCGEVTSRRRRRQAEETTPSDVGISVTIDIQRNDTTNIDDVLTLLNTSARDMWPAENVTFDLGSGTGALLDRNQSETGSVTVICADGMVPLGMTCVSCPKGTRYKLSINDCVPCGRATYQDEEGQLKCKLCPAYTTTVGPGAFEPAHCQDVCPSGQISFLGVIPCQKCPYGSYQPQRGQTGCKACPEGMTTRIEGATTYSQCTIMPTVRPPPAVPTTHVIGPVVTMETGPSVATPGRATVIAPVTTKRPDLPTTTGKVDIGIITKGHGGGTGGDGDNNTDQRPSQGKAKLPVAVIVGVGASVLVVVIVIAVVACMVYQKRRHQPKAHVLPRPRPVSWSGSTRAMITSDDEEDLDTDGFGLVNIHNPVYGMNDCNEPALLETCNFTSFLDASEPPVFTDPADIPKLAPPPKKAK